MKYSALISICIICNLPLTAQHLSVSIIPKDKSFSIVNSNRIATIFYDEHDAKVVGIAAQAFAKDVELITQKKPLVSSRINADNTHAIIVGTIGHSELIDKLIRTKQIDIEAIRNQREMFIISVIVNAKKQKQLVIAGSDRRGTAFGVFQLSRLMGVSPFVWWADVMPVPRKNLYVSGSYTSTPPSVEYRGIFINDEDWGIQPWAAAHCDTDIKDIGPKTYTKVFELLLRLKANYIWPAMHPCTKAFYYYKENPKVADDYAIMVGGSHCEPMLRNNVFEWSENFEHEYGKKPGEWRYDVNKEEIYKYWDDRIRESKPYESVFTVGMRGVHDGSMPGPKDIMEKKTLLEKVITDQREILTRNFKQPASTIPQIFVPYKEVLNIYQKGMKLPDDITIIWPDDNHGYIRQLPNTEEQKRAGSHGVYYHLSYWGSPHDYLWLSSISPALISSEMNKAYQYGAKKVWVFNVGDIKPAELEIQFCMDMAWNINAGKPENALAYVVDWAKEIFGEKLATPIADIKKEYYQLAAAGKPEHLGMVNFTEQEAMGRIARYRKIYTAANQLKTQIPERLKDAFDELIWYPVTGAYLMNEKTVYATQSLQLAAAGNHDALRYSTLATRAFDSIRTITDYYNKKIAHGKWDGMMSWHPRDQKVFEMPKVACDSTIAVNTALAAKTAWLPQPDYVIQIDSCTMRNSATYHPLISIPGLGISGKGTLIDAVSQNNLLLEYSVTLPAGNYRVVVKWLPTFDVSGNRQLNYIIAFDNEQPQTVNIHADADSEIWKHNVLNGYSSGTTIHTASGNTPTVIHLSPQSENMVLSKIEIYKQ